MTLTTPIRIALALICALCAGTALADQSTGRVTKVIDGDSIKLGRLEIRLKGVDAVEGDQLCQRPDGEPWPCGSQARRALMKLVAKQDVTCVHHGKDSYGRTLATCSIESGEEINDWLVRQGWAVAYRRYSRKYVEAEAEAKAAKRNIWSGTFKNPERHRHKN